MFTSLPYHPPLTALACSHSWGSTERYTTCHMKANGLEALKQPTKCCHLSSILPAATQRLSLCKTDICPEAFFPIFFFFSSFLLSFCDISVTFYVLESTSTVTPGIVLHNLILLQLETRARRAQWKMTSNCVMLRTMSGYTFDGLGILQRGCNIYKKNTKNYKIRVTKNNKLYNLTCIWEKNESKTYIWHD